MNKTIALLLIALLLPVFLLTGCASNRFKETTTVEEFQREYKEARKQESERLQRNFFSATSALCDPDALDYRLGPGDLIAVTVFEDKDMNSEVRVSSRGTVTLPMLGTVNVFRLTAVEAEKKIEDLLRQKYLHDPHVSIYIKEHVSHQITVVGALKNPGNFECLGKKSLLDVLALAGGLTPEAGEVAFVSRNNQKTGKRENYLVDLNALVRKGDMSQDIIILGGDEIFVPTAGHCFVDGAVRKPGIFQVRSNLTVNEAIAQAGGITNYADEDDIKLVRFVKKGKREVIRLQYSKLQAGQGDTIYIRDNDIIFVELSGIGTFFSGTGIRLGFMGTGINYKNPVK